MLMKDNKKSSLAVIIAKKLGKPEEASSAPESEGAELDQSMGYDSAGEEILKAIESKDKAMLVEAIKNIVQMCMDESPEEESEEYEQKPE